MKKAIVNKLIMFILIAMLTLCMAVGCTTMTNISVVDDIQKETTDLTNSDTSSVKFIVEEDENGNPKNTISGEEGKTFDLTLEVKMKVRDGVIDKKWGSADIFLYAALPDSVTATGATAADYFDRALFDNGKYYQFEEGSPFDDPNAYSTDVSLFTPDGHHSNSFLHFAMAAKSHPVDARNVLRFSVRLKLKQKIDDDAGLNVEFKVLNGQFNAISSYIYTGQNPDGERFTADYTDESDFDSNKHLNVDEATTQIIFANADDNVTVNKLSITNKLINDEKVFIEGGLSVTGTDKTYNTEGNGATRDQLVVNAEPENNGVTFELWLADVNEDGSAEAAVPIYKKAGPIVDFVLPLSTAHQKLTVKVLSSNKNDTTQWDFEIIQPFIGLDAFTATTDNQVEGVTKDGLVVDKDAAFDKEQKAYTVFAPVGKDGATGVTFNPVVAAGYSAKTSYSVSGDDTQNDLRSGAAYTFKFPEDAKKEYTLTFEFTGAIVNDSYAKKLEVVVTIKTVSVDTSLEEVKLGNATGEYVDDSGIVSINDNGEYVAQLAKANKYSTSVHYKTTEGSSAVMKKMDGGIVNNGALIGVSEDNLTNVFAQETFEYVFTVTAEAGNKKDISLILTKEILAGKIVSLEYSTAQYDGSGEQGFDWSNPQPITITDDYKAVLKLDPSFSRIGLRFGITDGAEYRVIPANIGGASIRDVSKQSDATNESDVYALNIFSLQQIRLGVSEIDISTFSDADGGAVSTLVIEIQRIESEYDIYDMSISHLDDNGNDTPLNDLSWSNLQASIGDDIHTNATTVLYPVSEINLSIKTNGASTYVYINGQRITNRKDTSEKENGVTIKALSEHEYTLALNPGRETTIEIISKGTNGSIEDYDNDKRYIINIFRQPARTTKTLTDLKAYLVKDIDGDRNPLTYINAQGKVVSKDEAQLISGFDPNTNNYYCEVGEDVEYNYIELVPEIGADSGAKVDGAGVWYANKPVANGSMEWTIRVTPESSKQGLGVNTYHIYIQAKIPPLNSDPTLKSIEMFTNRGKDLLSNLDGISIDGIPSMPNTINDPIEINVDYLTTGVRINVATFQAAATKRLIRIVNKDQSIEEIINGPDNWGYNIENFIDLNEGDNLFLITSKAQDGTKGVNYIFNIKRANKNENLDLSMLSAKTPADYELIKDFDENTTDYEVFLPSSGSGGSYVKFVAKTNAGANATIRIYVSGKIVAEGKNNIEYYSNGLNADGMTDADKAVTINPGESKIFNIEVESDGNTKQYYVTVKRNYSMGYINDIKVDIEDTDNHKSLIVATDAHGENAITKDNIVDLICEQDIRDFYVHIPYDTMKVSMTISVPEGMFAFDDKGQGSLKQTFNCLAIFSDPTKLTYTAKFSVANGTARTEFNFHIIREEGPDAATLSAIDTFTIKGLNAFTYKNDKTHYVFAVSNDITQISELISFKEGMNVKYKVLLNGNEVANTADKDLAIGINNLEFVFIAENGTTTRTVTVAVERMYATVGDVTIKNGDTAINTGIKIEDNNNSYSFTVDNKVQNLNVTFDLPSGYTLEVTGNNGLKAGETNVITATITGNDGFKRIIKFNVFRQNAEPEPPDLTMWYIIAGTLGGIALILLILTIVAFTTRSKRKGGGGNYYNDIGIGDYDLD